MNLKKFIQAIAIVLCFSFMNSVISVAASGASAMPQGELSVQDVSADSVSEQAKKQGEDYYVSLLFVFIHSKPSMFSSAGIVVYGRKVTVLSDSGFYTYVRTEDGRVGYIFSIFLSKSLHKSKSLTVPEYVCAYVGKASPTKVIAKYDGNEVLSWYVGDSNMISFDKETGVVKGLKPGVTKITARTGLFNSADCTVTVINQWKETEKATAQKQITIRHAPGDNYDAKITINKGTAITARGDLADGSGWIYVSAKNDEYWGFIKLSDFPGIDYLMTQYHYYDEGYDIRFGSASTKIYDYASVLNDVMMANFKLKVCPYVEAYTSAADNCKIMSYKSVASSNLAKACPKNGNHLSSSCLTTGNLREDLQDQYENGGGTVSKTAWTGHIMSDHNGDRSNATVGMGTIIFTPYSTVNPNTYANYSNSKIKEESTYTLVHETGHQLGLGDHYCYGIDASMGKCKNTYCSTCYIKNVKKCIMLDRLNVEETETTSLYCKICKENINSKLSESF